MIRKTIIGVPKKSWAIGHKRFSIDKCYEFTFQPSSVRPDWRQYSFVDDSGKCWLMPLNVIIKDFITL